jgi:hypothetical protein
MVIPTVLAEYDCVSAIYNVESDTWRFVPSILFEHSMGTSLVTLGTRVFAIGGTYIEIGNGINEEFDYKTEMWYENTLPMYIYLRTYMYIGTYMSNKVLYKKYICYM